MRKFIICFALLQAAVSIGYAQDKDILAIRTLYQQTEARIKNLASEAGKSEGLYLHLFSLNHHSGDWPGAGRFRYEEKYYFELEMPNRPPEKIVKICKERESAARRYEEEYLFNEAGELAFAFLYTFEEAENATRCYFKQGKLIRFMEGDKLTDSPNASQTAESEIIKSNAESLRRRFFEVMRP